jgi:DNA-binding NtrC family response regulator
VRIISATHRDLLERTRAGTFREDLFYRLNVIQLPLPALRDRPGDNVLLVNHFLARLTPEGSPSPSISPAAWKCLLQYPFPGNVRELSHAIEHAIILSDGREIGVQHLPVSMGSLSSPDKHEPPEDPTNLIQPLQVAIRDFEHAYLLQALRATQGKRARTAELLGISRKTLWEKLRGNKVRKQDYTWADDSPPEPASLGFTCPTSQQSKAGNA